MTASTLREEIGSLLARSREALRVSRARCYAMAPTGDFRLAASFGFISRFAPEDFLESSHPLVDWVQRHRKPAYANSPEEAGRLAEAMHRGQYFRVLAAPVYDGSRLVGILELQDRLSGGYFAADDLQLAASLSSRIGAVLASHNGTSVVPNDPLPEEDADALYDAGGGGFRDADFPAPPSLFSEDATAESPAPFPTAPAKPVFEAPRPTPALLPARREEQLLRGFSGTLLLIPDVDAVVFSTWTREAADLQIASRRPFSDSARVALLRSVEPVLASAMKGVRLPAERRFTTEYPLGRLAGEVDAFAGIQTSVLTVGSRVVLLSLLFSRAPEGAAELAFNGTHRLVRSALLQSAAGERYRRSFRSMVNAFLEPGLRPYPQLKAHSFAVAALCRRFTVRLGFEPDAVEQLTVAGLLHDIGIREVEVPYERLAGRRPLDLQEVALVRRHAPIGASLLERIDFPYPIAPLVRHHHERWDGAGYPDGLSGDRIPFGSRVLALAESFDAMTASHSYRAPISREAALEILAIKAGTQFDPQLAASFADLIRTGPPEPADPSGGSVP